MPVAPRAGRCILTWFNPYDLAKKILPGTQVRVTGKVTLFRNRYQITQPKVEFLDGKDADALAPKSARIEPVYPATLELPSPAIWRITKNILDELIPQLEEWFTPEFLAERNLLTRQEAMRASTIPSCSKTASSPSALAYHEFFLHQSAVAIKRYHQRNSNPAIPLRRRRRRRLNASAPLLPFDLTGRAKPRHRNHPQRPHRHQTHEPPSARRRRLRQNRGRPLRHARGLRHAPAKF